MVLNFSNNLLNLIFSNKYGFNNVIIRYKSFYCSNQYGFFSNPYRCVSRISESPCSETYNSDFSFSIMPFTKFQLRGPKIVKPRDIIKFWKIRPGDQVVVISGKDKGKTGEVLMCDHLRNQVKVKGCNMRKLVVDNQTVQIEKKIHYSNVQLLDKLLNVGTRVSIRRNVDNKPLRVSKKSGYVIPWPSKKNREPRGEKDTSPEEALKKTYDYKKDLESIQLLRQTMTKYNRDVT